jgi:DNA-binding MarR family transcriptional regulator
VKDSEGPDDVEDTSDDSTSLSPFDTSVLEALHVYRSAEAAMRRRTGLAMGLGENDLLALRYILDNHSLGRTTAAKDVTRYLGISTASTSVLLQRLEASGFIERRASSVDRRSIEIIPTAAAASDTGPMLAAAQRHMAESTQTLTADEAEVVRKFLNMMRDAVDGIGN